MRGWEMIKKAICNAQESHGSARFGSVSVGSGSVRFRFGPVPVRPGSGSLFFSPKIGPPLKKSIFLSGKHIFKDSDFL